MLRMKGFALAWVVGGGLTLAAPLALADNASAQKDRVEDRADQTKDHIDDATKAQKKAVDTRAERQKDELDRKADRKKDAVDSHANAEKAAIEHRNDSDKTAMDHRDDSDRSGAVVHRNDNDRVADRRNDSDKGGAKEEVSDSWITTKIKSRFVSEKALKGSDISVDTEHSGEVTLSGSAPSKRASERAFQLASTTKGVRTVNNQVVIAPAK